MKCRFGNRGFLDCFFRSIAIFSLAVLLGACRPAEETPPAETAAALPPPKAESACVGKRPCPKDCYLGPTSCQGSLCTRDRRCLDPDYNPYTRRREPGYNHRERRQKNSACKNKYPCPKGCYSGPSSCDEESCSDDLICDDPGFDPQKPQPKLVPITTPDSTRMIKSPKDKTLGPPAE